ncbi:zf-HC2 domain-containing protein [Thermogemmatispora onikobensis]|uniref:zf-HC2 domain-containing protein n=1 Tax=Thermogemmatispora onikobensis TaxID=732234 RepID=UPI000852FFED|nr:zf-HC2 domain-containing protein [Thermogemmatispora onikobensis]
MDCRDQFAPQTEELVMLAFGEEGLAPEVVRHLRACMICQRRLMQFQSLSHHLLTQLYRRQCPDGQRLSFYCAGLLSGEEQRQIAAHVQECPLCAEEVAVTRRFMADPLIPTVSAPSFLRLATPHTGRQAWYRLPDGGPSAVWPQYYHSEEFQLALHISSSSAGCYAVYGLLSCINAVLDVEAFEGRQAVLQPLKTSRRKPAERAVANADPLRLTAEIDRRGMLTFLAVPPGRYMLLLHLRERDLVIEELQIDGCGKVWS